MRIALDYDKTYTADPEMWDCFITLAKSHGHSVEVVTMRRREWSEAIPEQLSERASRVEYTDRKAKKPHMEALGRPVDVWIDDMPQFILQDAWTGD
jgi:hypothetical protein